jgi:hypothetical protein
MNRSFPVQDLLRDLAAATTSCADAEASGEVIKAARPLAYGFLDLPVADRCTDTDVHCLDLQGLYHATKTILDENQLHLQARIIRDG